MVGLEVMACSYLPKIEHIRQHSKCRCCTLFQCLSFPQLWPVVPRIGRQLWWKLSWGVLAIQANIEMMVAVVLVGEGICLMTMFAVEEERSRRTPTGRQRPTLPLLCAAA